MEGVAATALVAILEHPNGWHRETAARVLHQRQDSSVAPELRKLARESASAAARIVAMHVLEGLSMLDEGTLSLALKDSDADVRANAVRLCAITGLAREQLSSLAADKSSRVRAEVAWALVGDKSPGRIEVLSKLLEEEEQPWIRHAALAAAGADVEGVLAKLSAANPGRADQLRASLGSKASAVKPVPTFTGAGTRKEAVAQYAPALALKGDASKGEAIFTARCALCHRLRGRGTRVGPDLDAAHTSGREKLLGNILEPSRELTAGFVMGNVTLKSGEIASGILENETPAGVILRLPGGAERVIRKSDLAKVDRVQRSLMPEGIEGGLSVQEMADLLEFISVPPGGK
jgi:putative heme-binding domain-containing protein